MAAEGFAVHYMYISLEQLTFVQTDIRVWPSSAWKTEIFSTKIAVSKTQSQGPQLADYKTTLNLVIFQCKPLTSENDGKPSNEKNFSSMENEDIRNMYNSISLLKDSVSTQPTNNPNLWARKLEELFNSFSPLESWTHLAIYHLKKSNQL